MPTPQETLARLRAQMEQQNAGLLERLLKSAAGRTFEIHEGAQKVSPQRAGQFLFEKLVASDPERARELHEGQQLALRERVGEATAVPEAETFGEKAADFVGDVAPDIALAAATAPIGGAGALLTKGGPFAQLLAREAVQSAALAPTEFASRSPGEAAIATVTAPIAGTLLGRLGARLLPKKTAQEVQQEALEAGVVKAAAKAKESSLEKIRQSLREGVGKIDDPDLDAESLQAVGREVFQDSLRKSVDAATRGGANAAEMKRITGGLEQQLSKLDPSTSRIVAESIQTLPDSAALKMSRAVAAGPREGESVTHWIRKVRASAMLSGFGTHFRNFLGTGMNVISKPARTLAGAAADLPFAGAQGIATGIKDRSLREGVRAFKESRERFFVEAGAEVYSMFRSLSPILRQAGQKARAIREIAGNVEEKTFKEQFADAPASAIVETPMRMLNLADRWWYDIVFKGQVYRQAARQAVKEGHKGNKLLSRIGKIIDDESKLADRIVDLRLKANEADQFIKAKVFEGDKAKKLVKFRDAQKRLIRQLEKKSGIEESAMMADRTIFTAREGESLDKILDEIDKISRIFPLPDLILPFRRTPANVARETLRNTPIGAIGGTLRAVNRLRGGASFSNVQGRLADDIGQAAVGTTVMYALLGAASAGMIRVNPFKRNARAERITEEAAGVVPDSIIVGNRWSIPISRLEPIGSMLLAAAKVADLRGDEPPETIDEIRKEISQFADILATQALAETFMEPLADFTDGLTSDEPYFNRWAQSLGASFVPRAITQFRQIVPERLTPERVKETPTLLGSSLEANVLAGFQQALPGRAEADLGLFGKERRTQTPLASLAFGRTGEVGNDPVAQEMVRVGAYHQEPTGLSKDAQEKLERRGIGYSEAEDRTLRQAKGRLQRVFIQGVIDRPIYQRLGRAGLIEAQKSMIDKEYQRAGRVVNARANALKRARVPLTQQSIFGGI